MRQGASGGYPIYRRCDSPSLLDTEPDHEAAVARSLARAIFVPALTIAALDARAQNTFKAEQPVASIPVDLALAAGGYGVVARFSAYPDELNPALGGRDWYRFSMRPVQMVGSGIGGKGACAGGADALEVVGLRSVSISKDPDPTVTGGHVHFVHLQ